MFEQIKEIGIHTLISEFQNASQKAKYKFIKTKDYKVFSN